MKKMMHILMLLLTISSCNVNTTYNNRESDKQEAEIITKQFYESLKKEELSKAINLFSREFFSATDTAKLYEFIHNDNSIAGNIESYILSSWQTTVVQGTNAHSDYILMYIIRRQKKDTKEVIALQKEEGKIKIVGYNVDHEP